MIDDPGHWRQRAEESRAEAEKLSDASVKQALLGIAAGFERLAEIAERRTAAKRA